MQVEFPLNCSSDLIQLHEQLSIDYQNKYKYVIFKNIWQERKSRLTTICYQYESFDMQPIRFKSPDRKNLTRTTGSKRHMNVGLIQLEFQ